MFSGAIFLFSLINHYIILIDKNNLFQIQKMQLEMEWFDMKGMFRDTKEESKILYNVE
jgi:hypothetical protein